MSQPLLINQQSGKESGNGLAAIPTESCKLKLLFSMKIKSEYFLPAEWRLIGEIMQLSMTENKKSHHTSLLTVVISFGF